MVRNNHVSNSFSVPLSLFSEISVIMPRNWKNLQRFNGSLLLCKLEVKDHSASPAYQEGAAWCLKLCSNAGAPATSR
jgi:hypothetical protein